MAQPPAFENKEKCFKCASGFGLFNRKHHCRNCGKTCCNDCSSKSTPLLEYGFNEPVRVCDPCYDKIQAKPRGTQGTSVAPRRSPSPDSPRATPKAFAAGPASASASTTASATSTSSALSTPASRQAASQAPAKKALFDEEESSAAAKKDAPEAKAPVKKVAICKCGFPMCICPADPVEKKDDETEQSGEKPKARVVPPSAAAKNAANAHFQAFATFNTQSAQKYDLTGDLNEQARDAIKACDYPGVAALLKAGASAAYKDRTGNTLVHLAAMFNRLDLVALLVKNGADVTVKNPAGETAVDLAPPALAARMQAGNYS